MEEKEENKEKEDKKDKEEKEDKEEKGALRRRHHQLSPACHRFLVLPEHTKMILPPNAADAGRRVFLNHL